jgi:hypothetical protein
VNPPRVTIPSGVPVVGKEDTDLERGVRAMSTERLDAAVAFLADTLESEQHRYAPLARRVLLQAGLPSASGAQALYDLQVELSDFGVWADEF